MKFSVTAFMCVFNEADILPWTIRHLIAQGVDVHVIDNWSSDASPAIAQSFPLIGWERFPADGPSKYFSLRALLHRVEDLAEVSKANWCVHHDADEIRRSNVPGERLVEAYQRSAYEGYNRTYVFYPTDEGYQGNPENYFRYYTDDTMRRINAWQNSGHTGRVDLASTGGHAVRFPRMQVHPQKLILKHYPIRNSVQGERKVIHERLERYDPVELKMGWHVQYTDQQWIRNPASLSLYSGPDGG